MRVHEYAKENNILSKDVLIKAKELWPSIYFTASSGLREVHLEELNKAFNQPSESVVPPASPQQTQEVRPMLQLEQTYKLDVQSSTGKVWVIVGAGGNGAYLVPNLLRQISIQNARLHLNRRPLHKIVIIDADIVEEKNLTRQNFVRNDVGKNKAEVMATRYGKAFGLEVDYIPEYIESSEQLSSIVKTHNLKPVFIGAVDNNKTRVIIEGSFKAIKQAFWIDGGNEEWGGQVVCGYNLENKSPVKGEKGPHHFHLPSVVELYPEVGLATDKLPSEMSCAERAVSNPQNIFTNMTAANLMMGFANTILTANANDGEGLKQHAIAFNSQALSFTTRLNTLALLTPAPAPKVEVKAEVKTEVGA
jgi:PRTRC genetic system ThiF family protein